VARRIAGEGENEPPLILGNEAPRTPAMKGALTLALDVGTTSAKVALFDARGRRALLLRERLPLHRRAHGGFEQDPRDYVRAVRRLLARAEDRLPRPSRVVRAESPASDRRGRLGAPGRKAGRPAVTWMDRRAAPLVAKLERSAGEVARRTGSGSPRTTAPRTSRAASPRSADSHAPRAKEISPPGRSHPGCSPISPERPPCPLAIPRWRSA
jgi:hypothetical protein